MNLYKKLILFVFFILALHPILGLNIESFSPLLFLFTALFLGSKNLTKNDFKFIIPASLFYLFTIITLLYTENIHYGIKEILKGLGIIIIPISFSLFKNALTKEHINIFLKLYVVALVLYGIYLIFHIVNVLELYNTKVILLAFQKFNFKYTLLGETYKSIHPTYYSAGIILGILICLECYSSFRLKVEKIISVIIIIFFIFLLFILRVRIAFLSLIIIVPLYLFLSHKTRKKRQLLLGVMVITIFISSFFIMQNRGLRKAFYSEIVIAKNSVLAEDSHEILNKSRIDIYRSSINIIKKNLLFGVGVGDVNDELKEEYKLRGLKEFYEGNLYNSHNQYLHYALAGGIFGFIIFIYCLGYNFNYSIREKDYLYMSFLILFFTFILTENLLNRISGIFFFALFNSLFHFRNKYLLKTEKLEK